MYERVTVCCDLSENVPQNSPANNVKLSLTFTHLKLCLATATHNFSEKEGENYMFNLKPKFANLDV